MNAARRVGVLVAHEVRLARRDPTAILVLIAFPVIMMAFLKPVFRPALVETGHAHANGAEQVVPGQAAMAAFFLVSMVTFAFFAEHGWSTWDRLRASAATSGEIVLGKSLPFVAIGLVQFAVVLGTGVAFFGLHIRGSVLALVPLLSAFVVSLVLLGVAVTALCKSAQQANAFGYSGMVIFGAIGGAFVPFALLPAWARTIAPVTPTSWVMRGLRAVVLDGRGLGAIAAPTLVLLGMAALFAAVALRRLRFDEAKLGWAYA